MILQIAKTDMRNIYILLVDMTGNICKKML